MKKNKFIYLLIIAATLTGGPACKKQLDVKNPNQPNPSDAKTEPGIISLAMGGVYTNGWNGVNLGPLNWLGNSYFSLVYGYHELMGDVIQAEASNQNINVINLPDYVILDDGTKIINSSPSKSVNRISNARSNRSANAFYYEWAYMYSLNNACNTVLSFIDGVNFTGDAATKKNTLKAWCYWWKGYAYSRIGSMYYSAVIADSALNNLTSTKSSLYKIHDSIIVAANRNLDQATTLLGAVTTTVDYSTVLGNLIPLFCQTGNGGVLTVQEWIHNINSLKARNLLVNKPTSAMTPADWNTILALTNNGIQKGERVFTGRTAASKGFFSASTGSATAMTTGDNTSTTFTVSMRLIQDYKTGDQRLPNNFTAQKKLNQVGGFTFSTLYKLVSGGNGISGVSVLSNLTAGSYELFIACSYEENELMKAEAKINTGDIDGGLASVDKVRTYQGAGLSAVSGAGLSLAAAKEELRKERRVGLAFRALAFYDARRWGVIYDVSKGGGRTGCTVLTSTGVLNTNAAINYNFLDYWDVPDDEASINPAAAGSAPVKNPD